MSDLAKYENMVDRYVRGGNGKKAIKLLLALVDKYAEKQDLGKAEALRERIISIDPMALSAVIAAQEIIDNARSKPASKGHQEVWHELYQGLIAEEAGALQNELEEVIFQPGQTIFSQGQKNSNLYFIDSGQAKHIFTQDNREIFIKRVSAGNLANEESFIDASLCTTTLVAVTQVKAHFLPAMTLLSWEGYLPALEPKLRDLCAKEVKIHDLLKKSSQDRRIQRRVPLPGRILLKIVDAAGEVVGKTIRGDIGDVSEGGVSFYVQAANREQAQMLLGHNLHLRFNLPPDMIEVEQIGRVLGVRHHTARFETKEKYSVHVKFSEVLPEQSVVEAERFVSMMKIAERNR